MLRPLAAALVVAHDRAAAPAGIDVDPVDHPAQPDLVGVPGAERDRRQRALLAPRTRTAARARWGSHPQPSAASCSRYRRRSASIVRSAAARTASGRPGAIVGGISSTTSLEDPQRVAERLRRDRAAEPPDHLLEHARACSCRGRAGRGQARATPVTSSRSTSHLHRAVGEALERAAGDDLAVADVTERDRLPSAASGSTSAAPPSRGRAAAERAHAPARSAPPPDPRRHRRAAAGAAARGPVGHEQLGQIGEERRGQREIALLVGAAVAEHDLLASRARRTRTAGSARGRATCSLPQVAARMRAPARGDARRTETARRRRQAGTRPRSGRRRTPPGSAGPGSRAARRAAPPPARAPGSDDDLEPIEQLEQLRPAHRLAEVLELAERAQQRRQRASIELLVCAQQRRRSRGAAPRTAAVPAARARRA